MVLNMYSAKVIVLVLLGAFVGHARENGGPQHMGKLELLDVEVRNAFDVRCKPTQQQQLLYCHGHSQQHRRIISKRATCNHCMHHYLHVSLDSLSRGVLPPQQPAWPRTQWAGQQQCITSHTTWEEAQ